jgi:HlyD family secretion protein
MKTAKIFTTAFIVLLFISCGKTDSDFDAAGSFETTEILVSAEAQGRIMQFDIEEGQSVTENQIVGYIDSTQLFLKKEQLIASQKGLQSRRPDIRKQMAVLEQQIATAKTEKKRVENLLKANAATAKQLDDVNAQIAVLEKQLAASKTTLESTDEGMSSDNKALDIQIQQLEDQLTKCRIISPASGVVLTKYAEKGELAGAGKALFKVANLDNMILRAYITNEQLTQIKIGQKVTVTADFGEEQKQYEGIISWVSAKSEFTPKTIQTRDERANLVYAIKVSVKNDGYLKIGMYGNVKFN